METTFDVDFLNSGNADLECLPNDLANTDEYRTGTAADENDASRSERIHYDFRWKVSQRDKIRARPVCSGSELGISLAPSDYWNTVFQSRLASVLQDKDKFPERSYSCEATNVNISIERTRQRGLNEQFDKMDINWDSLDNHIDGLSDLRNAGKKVVVQLELFYKNETDHTSTANRSNRKKSATEAQKAQMAAEAGLWTRVYKHHRCRAKHCKQGPHCTTDKQGNHLKLEARHLEDIFNEIKHKMKEGETEDEVDVRIEIPPRVLQDVLARSQKRKPDSEPSNCRPSKTHVTDNCVQRPVAEDSLNITGDIAQRLEEYCNW
ncbi:hypothetical protein JX266_014398, partial [Neoarthrinium moseri]